MAQLHELANAVKLLGRPVAFYPSIARILGMKEALFLCQLIYWTPRGYEEDGWIYKTVDETIEETGLTYKEQIRARSSLVKTGLMEQKYDRHKHQLFFKIAVGGLSKFASKVSDQKADEHMTKSKIPSSRKSGGICPKVSSYKEAEITTETTTEIKGVGAIPSDLGSLAKGLLENLGYPTGNVNLRAAMDSIHAEMRAGRSAPAAYEYILAKACDAKERNEISSIRFWLADAKYNQIPKEQGGKGGTKEVIDRAIERLAKRTQKQVRGDEGTD